MSSPIPPIPPNAGERESPASLGNAPTGPKRREYELERVAAAINGLRFGTVQVYVQDGVVVQIERTEKQRLR